MSVVRMTGCPMCEFRIACKYRQDYKKVISMIEDIKKDDKEIFDNFDILVMCKYRFEKEK